MPDKAEIENTLKSEIATILALDEDQIDAHTPLDTLGIDSIRLMEILIFIEKEYGVRLVEAGLESGALRDAASLAESVEKALETGSNGVGL